MSESFKRDVGKRTSNATVESLVWKARRRNLIFKFKLSFKYITVNMLIILPLLEHRFPEGTVKIKL